MFSLWSELYANTIKKSSHQNCLSFGSGRNYNFPIIGQQIRWESDSRQRKCLCLSSFHGYDVNKKERGSWPQRHILFVSRVTELKREQNTCDLFLLVSFVIDTGADGSRCQQPVCRSCAWIKLLKGVSRCFSLVVNIELSHKILEGK